MNPDNPAPHPEKKDTENTYGYSGVQAWLDGEAGRDGLASADEQETAAFWTKVNDEAEMLRRRKTRFTCSRKFSVLSRTSRQRPGGAASGHFLLRQWRLPGGVSVAVVCNWRDCWCQLTLTLAYVSQFPAPTGVCRRGLRFALVLRF